MKKFNRIMRLNITLDKKRNLIQAIKLPVEFHRNWGKENRGELYDPCCIAIYNYVDGKETLVGIAVQNPYFTEEYDSDNQYIGDQNWCWDDYYYFRKYAS